MDVTSVGTYIHFIQIKAAPKWGCLNLVRVFITDLAEAHQKTVAGTRFKASSTCSWSYYNTTKRPESSIFKQYHFFERLSRQAGITEELKAENQLEWVRKMNNIRQQAEETVFHDLIDT